MGEGLTEAAVRAYLTALNGGDPDEIAAWVAPDFHNEHTSAAGRSLRGRSAYRKALAGFLAEFDELRYELEELIVQGDHAAAAYRMKFRYSGRNVVIRGMFRFRVADGLIAHRVDYWDGAEFTRQIS